MRRPSRGAGPRHLRPAGCGAPFSPRGATSGAGMSWARSPRRRGWIANDSTGTSLAAKRGAAVIEDARLGRERYRVRGTPTLMLANGTKVRHPLAYPHMEERKVVGVAALPCYGEECLEATRALIERALTEGFRRFELCMRAAGEGRISHILLRHVPVSRRIEYRRPGA